MTPEQCKTARKLLGWSKRDLARFSGVMARTLDSWECGTHPSLERMVSMVRRAFEEAGVVLVPDGGERAVVMLRNNDGTLSGIPAPGGRITPEKCKIARKLLGRSQAHLAQLACVDAATVAGYETDKGLTWNRTVRRIQAALEADGIEFRKNGSVRRTGDCATIAMQCKAARAKLGWTQDKVARAADVTQSLVSALERGSFIHGGKGAQRIMSVLEIALARLETDDPSRSP
ncbi:helix-turn-helix transcriptional regulator [Azospirillum canadense]|uniref:helix-turn-helix transcriptional regulator n=1 Tax=Azospirillum canadense TaxID=403962 RepID=UPI0022277D17|nr:helix-turn-helix transcriptional regulator [Azospirillum canadense]MCW2240949.1 transcriptional regulator with XRE-family HTH domain [Azospirillum canadense]